VVLDLHIGVEGLRQIGRICELARIDAVWAYDRLAADNAAEAIAALTVVGDVTRELALGLALDSERRAPQSNLSLIGGLAGGAAAGRLELTLRAAPSSAELAPELRDRIKLGLRLAELTSAQCELAAQLADDAVVSAAALGGTRGVGGVVEAVRTACRSAGRDPASLGIALEVPVSVGRTTAEAFARAASEPSFADSYVGKPADVGLFGTLEQCQAAVVELAHAGVTELRCWLPNTPDLPDVIAQLTAAVVGRLDVLRPSAPRSRDPDPPAGWGGRPRFPRAHS
jgi:hypothetical protein